MLGYMNAEALEKTQQTGLVTFFSRSKGRLWTKGETSGNRLEVVEILEDCDRDTLLVRARPAGPVCHTGADTCFNQPNTGRAAFLQVLEQTLQHRKSHPVPDSHSSQMFAKGINKIAQKVGEEAVELVIEAKDSNPDLFRNEAADLLYRFTMLLVAKGTTWDEVIRVLEERHT